MVVETLLRPKLVPLQTNGSDEKKDFALITGTSHPQFGRDMAEILDAQIDDDCVGRFADNEIKISLSHSVRDKIVFIIQTMGPPHQNDYLNEAMFLADAAKRSSAAKVVLVSPYLAYARQDRMNQKRSSISVGTIVRALMVNGVDAFITADMHSQQSQVAGDRPIPWDDLYGSAHTVPEAMKYEIDDVVATDAGAIARTTAFNGLLDLPDEIAIGIKRRDPVSGKPKYIALSKDVRDRNLLIVDDQISTGDSLVGLARLSVEKGAKSVRAAVTHGPLVPSALEILDDDCFEDQGIITTDSINHPPDVWRHPKITVVNSAPLFAEAIRRIVTSGEEISPLFQTLYIDGKFYKQQKQPNFG